MIKVNIPDKKTKQGKASIRGLWYSTKSGLCYDYLRKAKIEADSLGFVRRHYKQEALFYTEKRKAFIWYNTRKIEVLNHQTYFAYDRGKAGLKAYIKDILKRYGGLTIYIREQNYLIEVWQ